MIKKIKYVINLCAIMNFVALSLISCKQPTTASSSQQNTPEVKYKVTFDENGHGTKPSAIEVKENTVLNSDQLKPLTTDEDFSFNGWFDGDVEAKGGSYKVIQDVTLKAKWIENSYTVTFKNDKGTSPAAISGVKKNSTLKKEQIKTLADIEGFSFAGWTVDNEIFDENYKITKSITVTAKWIPFNKVQDVTFSKIGDVDYLDEVILSCNTPGATIHYTVGNEPEQILKTSVKLQIKEACTVTAYATKEGMIKSDINKVNYTLKTYTVTFNTNGHGPASFTNTLLKGEKVTKPSNPTTTDEFTFDGWFADVSCIIVWDFNNETVTKDITLYAKWKGFEKVDNVTFSKGSGEVDFNEEVTLNCKTPDATIHYIIGNDIEKTCKTGTVIKISDKNIKAYATKEGMTKSSTTNANYTIKTYKITFNTNGHGNTPADIPNLKRGDIVAKPENLIVDNTNNILFEGWFNGENKITSDIIMGTSDIMLTAKWCNIGDIILSTGKVVPCSQITNEEKLKAIAVVCGTNTQGNLIGLGLKERCESWAAMDTTGDDKLFSEIVCTPSHTDKDSINRGKVQFNGDIDGSDNWSKICSVDSNAAATAKQNYPAFDLANNYSINLPKDCPDIYKTGWYIPSLAEFYKIYKNVSDINRALDKIGENYATRINTTADSSNGYWSSSQCDDNFDRGRAWIMWCYVARFDKETKYNSHRVRCVKAF